MGAPQIIMIILLSWTFAVAALRHGEPQGDYNVGYRLLDVMLTAGLLYWGGFWS